MYLKVKLHFMVDVVIVFINELMHGSLDELIRMTRKYYCKNVIFT